jgi:hypothetical protein
VLNASWMEVVWWNLVETTSRTSFTWPATFGRKLHSLPYSILCVSLWGLHPNVIFLRESQLGVPKLRFLLSHNFGCSHLPQIKLFLRMQEWYLIALKTMFLVVYNTPQLELIWSLLLRGLWSRVKISNWFELFLLIITHCKSGLNEQCKGAFKTFVFQDLFNGVMGVQFSACLPL